MHISRKSDTPGNFVAGSGSPVKLDSSTVLLPTLTIPSAGIRSYRIARIFYRSYNKNFIDVTC